MKLSELQALCEKAIAKHGDMPLGVHWAEEASEVSSLAVCDGAEIRVRILFERSNSQLPGEPVEEASQPGKQSSANKFAVLFYE